MRRMAAVPSALLIACVVSAVSLPAAADYIDVIEFRIDEGCTAAEFQKLSDAGRKVLSDGGYTYRFEILTPTISRDQQALYQLGRVKDFATFAQEFSRWQAAVAKGGTPEAAHAARVEACSTVVSRAGFATD